MADQTALAVTDLDKIEAFAQNEKVINSFIQVIGNKRQAMSYISSALLAVSASAELMKCEPASIWSSVLRVATLRLSCEPALAQAHLVPFNNWKTKKTEATVILGWRGIKQIAMRTNKYRYINSRELYEGQIWDEDQLTGDVKIRGQRSGDKILGYFNFFELYSGYSHGLYMTVEELRAHGERYSKTYNFTDRSNKLTSKWHTDFPYMALKTVTRLNLLRNGYMNPEDAAILDTMADEAGATEGETIDTTFRDVEPGAPAPKPTHTAAQNLNDLGYDPEPEPDPKPTTPEPAPVDVRTWTSKKVSLEMAQTEKASDGTLYWEMTTDQLAIRFNGIEATIKKNGLTQEKKESLLLKKDIVQAIMDWRAANSTEEF